MSNAQQPPVSLKEACIQAARDVIAQHGVEGLSMRDVARMLGISHQAPYRHFESRDHLLAEIIRRCFVEFAQHLDQRPRSGDPEVDLGTMGRAYLDYAARKPLEYRLMFGTPWPEPADHPELVRHAVVAFNMLRDHLRSMQGGGVDGQVLADQQAMFIWSALHGMASITQSNVMRHLGLSAGVELDLQRDLLGRIGQGLRWVQVPISPQNSRPKSTQKTKRPRV
jgi:AcrR family transcriptional regulator